MNIYSMDQEIKDLLWGTPMPITVMLNSDMTLIHIKGSCSLIVTDAALAQEKMPDSKALASQARSALAFAATEAMMDMSKKVTSFEQLVTFKPEFSTMLKIKAMNGLSGLGLKIAELEIHSIERA